MKKSNIIVFGEEELNKIIGGISPDESEEGTSGCACCICLTNEGGAGSETARKF